MNKHDFLKELAGNIKEEYVVTPLGDTSGQWHNIKDRPSNFYMLGSMGLSISFALGIALSTKNDVIAIEGDGSILMNLGALATVGKILPNNLKIIILDNECYASTGCQETPTAQNTKLNKIAESCGINEVKVIQTIKEFRSSYEKFCEPGTKLYIIKIQGKEYSKNIYFNKTPEQIVESFKRVNGEFYDKRPVKSTTK